MKPSTRLNAAIPVLALLVTALLLSLLWTGNRQDRMDGTHSSAPESRRARIALPGAEASSSPASRQRRSHDQADARINSLLDIRPGEVAMIRIPAEGLSEFPGEFNDASVSLPTQLAMFSKAQTASMLKELDGRGIRFTAQVGDQSRSEFGFNGATIRTEITEDHADYSVVSIQNFVNGSRTLQTSTTMFKGYSTLLRLNGPESDGLLIVISSEAKPAEP